MRVKPAKRILALLLCALIMLSTLIIGSATSEELVYGDYTYTVVSGKAIIVSYTETATGNVNIPDSLGGYSVSSIDDFAFFGCTLIDSVDIPDSVTKIGKYAFAYCSQLSSVKIPSSVVEIGEKAFNASNNVTMFCEPGSYAENYAKENGVKSEISESNLSAEEFLINGNSYKYNKNLAEYCTYFCEKANTNIVDEITTMYQSNGYTDVLTYNFGSSGAFALGHKTVGDTEILTVTTKGTTKLAEGIGDYFHGGEEDFLQKKIWHNIYEYEESVWNALESYVSTYLDITSELKLKVLVTGHSLGGACANVLAARIVHTSKKGPATWTSIVPQASIFCYTFGAIKALVQDENIENGYENIHNVYNYLDDYGPNGTLAILGVGSLTNKFGHTDLFVKDFDGHDNHNIANYRTAIENELVVSCSKDLEKEQEFWINGKKNSVSLSFDEKWFSDDSKIYNHELCKFTSKFAMLGYDQGDGKGTRTENFNELRSGLEKCGFEDIIIDKGAGSTRVDYCIANRSISINGEQYTLVFANFIGTNSVISGNPPRSQWHTDFEPGYGSTDYEINWHNGFKDAENFAYRVLSSYFSSEYYPTKQFDRDKTIILLTGHSRGAATANLLASSIIDSEEFAKKENIYAYTFATPNTALDLKHGGNDLYADKYLRIFNIVNPEDLVTKFLPTQWGFGRYGRTLTLPSKTNCSSYEKLNSYVQPYFIKYTGREYSSFRYGEEPVYGIIKLLTDNVHSTFEYTYKGYKYGDTYISMQTFFFDTICKIFSGEDVDFLNSYYNMYFKTTSGFLRNFVAKLVRTASGEIISVADKMVDMHRAETYCAWVCSLNSSLTNNWDKYGDGSWGEHGSYKGVINCPVDVEIYDKNTNELVGKIKNNVVDEKIAAKPNSVVMSVDGDSKSCWLPSDGDYEIKLTGNDNGTMDYTISEINSDTGETERSNFFNVPIIKGKSWVGETQSENYDIDNHVLISDEGSKKQKTETFTNESKQFNITVSAEGNGYVSGSLTAVSGDYVTVSASPDENNKFIGWFEGSKLVSSEKVYSFVAKSDRNLVAKFENDTYCVGDIIEYGTYPQSQVTDIATISALNRCNGKWISYGYYSGTGTFDDGQMKPSDYMRYKDVVYNGCKYRAVTFDSYRPYYTGYKCSDSISYQDDNGYIAGNVYWFKYEPLEWRVLNPSTGMVMCENIIDSQPYNNFILESGKDGRGYSADWGDNAKTYYSNNYEKSSLREWLNNNFYNTAFSNGQKSNILSTVLDNSAYNSSYSEYNSATTNDKIYILSWNDVHNTEYGFTNQSAISNTRRASGSDYAKCQGLTVYNDYSSWLLRTPTAASFCISAVLDDGDFDTIRSTCSTVDGIRPVMRLSDLKSDITEDISTLDDAKINTASRTTVDWRTGVTIVVTAENVPDGYCLVMTINGKDVKGTNNEVVYRISELKSDIDYSVKIVDANGEIQKYSNGDEIKKDGGKIVCNAGFFKKLVAFFKGLFGILPKVEIKP